MINAIDCSRVDCSKWVGSPPEKEFIIQDWLSIGHVSYLNGDYEVGKSLLVQQLMTAVATGKPWLSIDVKQVKTYALFCEDEKEDLIRKQCAINELYQLNADFPDLANNIRLLSRAGENNSLIVFNDSYTGRLTPYFYDLLEDIKSFQPKLVILDAASDLFGGDENICTHRRQFMQLCCANIARTVNCAVLLCKHDTNIDMWHNRALYLSRSEEARDERVLHCGRSSHLLRYQNGVFVI